MQLQVINCSYHCSRTMFLCAGLERVDDTTVLGKLDRKWRSIKGKQVSLAWKYSWSQLIHVVVTCISHGNMQ